MAKAKKFKYEVYVTISSQDELKVADIKLAASQELGYLADNLGRGVTIGKISVEKLS